MKKLGCADCKYVSEKRDYNGWLTCKRNPPTTMSHDHGRGHWPKVADEEWCWQWEEKEIIEEEEE